MRAEFLADGLRHRQRPCARKSSSLLAAVDDSGEFLSRARARRLRAADLPRRLGRPARRSDRRRTPSTGASAREAWARSGGRATSGSAATWRSSCCCRIRRTPPNAWQAFQREARAAGALNHTNLLTVYDVGDHDGAAVSRDGVSRRASRCGRGCARGAAPRRRGPRHRPAGRPGLGAAHARGIVHRDLKPENIFLARRRPGEDPRLRPRDAARHAAAPALTVADDAVASRTARSPCRHRRLHGARAGARRGRRSSARTSSRSAPCSTKCSPARRLFRGETHARDAGRGADARAAGSLGRRTPRCPRALVARRAPSAWRNPPHDRFAAADDRRGRARGDHRSAAGRHRGRRCARSCAGQRRSSAALLVHSRDRCGRLAVVASHEPHALGAHDRGARCAAAARTTGDYAEAFLLARRGAGRQRPTIQELQSAVARMRRLPSFLAANPPGAERRARRLRHIVAAVVRPGPDAAHRRAAAARPDPRAAVEVRLRADRSR